MFLRLSLSLEAMKAALKIISDLRLHYTRYVGVTGGRLQNLSRRYHDLSMTVVISTEGKKFNYSSRNSGNGKSKIVHIYRYFLDFMFPKFRPKGWRGATKTSLKTAQ